MNQPKPSPASNLSTETSALWGSLSPKQQKALLASAVREVARELMPELLRAEMAATVKARASALDHAVRRELSLPPAVELPPPRVGDRVPDGDPIDVRVTPRYAANQEEAVAVVRLIEHSTVFPGGDDYIRTLLDLASRWRTKARERGLIL